MVKISEAEFERILGELQKGTAAGEVRLDNETRAALERLIDVAQHDTGQSRKVASLLLAWYNATDYGGFDFTDLWGLDCALVEDSRRLIFWISHNCCYPEDIGYRDEFCAIWKQWRAEKAAV